MIGNPCPLDRTHMPRHLCVMTMHVPVGEAKARLSELIAAAVRGEDVVLDSVGAPQVRLVMVHPSEVERRAAKRRSAIGMFADVVGDRDIDVRALKADDRWDEHYGRKFGDLD
jgi:antitoxin (DNA-binding transcriptional repressor) of toxin-antitoxin stability system